jgi:hypothetical protein
MKKFLYCGPSAYIQISNSHRLKTILNDLGFNVHEVTGIGEAFSKHLYPYAGDIGGGIRIRPTSKREDVVDLDTWLMMKQEEHAKIKFIEGL